ncbi:hypothetical protein MKW94_023384 [Papaver nudicaule]|uniref:S-protein homolog n=1 Tax=Papaver nudicaule TaxID=74823 RepID=A0AA41SN92_PAPNU|nr:hypothetical protein [Papaver nudicaule]
MSKSFLVIGSVLSILLCICAQSAHGFSWGEIFASKKNVTVVNDLDPYITLRIHCRSSDDDLGEHFLGYHAGFSWRFKVNLKQTTDFWCDSSWTDVNGKLYQKPFTAYNANRDWMRHCHNNCVWRIRQDGGYYGDGYDKQFPSAKMFTY